MPQKEKFANFLKKVDALCRLARTGWVMRGVPNAESVGAHSWRVALMALQKEQQLLQQNINVGKVVQMCLLHDMGEAVIGDIVPEHHQITDNKISKEEKKRLETKAVYDMAEGYAFPLLKTVFDEYEAQQTPEAVAVKNLDKIDMLLQACEYLQMYPELERLNEFMICNEQDVTMPIFQKDLAEIKYRQSGSGAHQNEFIDLQTEAGKVKHTKFFGDMTVAEHNFRTAVTALYFREALQKQNIDVMSVVRAAILQNTWFMSDEPDEKITAILQAVTDMAKN